MQVMSNQKEEEENFMFFFKLSTVFALSVYYFSEGFNACLEFFLELKWAFS